MKHKPKRLCQPTLAIEFVLSVMIIFMRKQTKAAAAMTRMLVEGSECRLR